MRSRQVSRGQEKFIDDLSARKDKCFPEKLCPFFFRKRMIAVEPVTERTRFFLQLKNLLSVDNGGVDLEPVANDASVIEQAVHILLTILRYSGNIEIIICLAEVIRLFQDGDPGKPGLVDLEDEAFEKQVIVRQWETVLGVMICSIENIFRVGIAVFAVSCHTVILLLLMT